MVYAKDIMNITGRKERAQESCLLRSGRNTKKKGSFITTKEFCEFTGIEEELTRSFMI